MRGDAIAKNVSCARCGALPGAPCQLTARAGEWHLVRIRDAQTIARASQRHPSAQNREDDPEREAVRAIIRGIREQRGWK